MSDRALLLQRQLMIGRMIHSFIWNICNLKLERMANTSVTGWHDEKLGLTLVVNIPRDSEITAESVLNQHQHKAHNYGAIEFYANREISVILGVDDYAWLYCPAESGTAPTYIEILMDEYLSKITTGYRLQMHEALHVIVYYIDLKAKEAAENNDLTVGSRTVPRIE